MIKDNEIIKNTIDNLILMMEEDYTKFHNIYRSLPFDIYKKIEKMAVTKSTRNEELHTMAKKISIAFHKKFK